MPLNTWFWASVVDVHLESSDENDKDVPEIQIKSQPMTPVGRRQDR